MHYQTSAEKKLIGGVSRNFADYRIKTPDFSIHPEILTALGFSTDAYAPAPQRNISLKYSNETEIYPVVLFPRIFHLQHVSRIW